MPVIHLETTIKSDIEICFDLSRSIDLHKISTSKTNENAIAGVTQGLINLNESVTWKARHFGITQNLTSKITRFKRPYYFRDEQIKGAFRYMRHDHIFKLDAESVVMTDTFDFSAPYGLIGKLLDVFVLTAYLRKFLEERNEVIKHYAETTKWKSILNEP